MSPALYAIVNAVEGVLRTFGAGFNSIVTYFANGFDGVIGALSS